MFIDRLAPGLADNAKPVALQGLWIGIESTAVAVAQPDRERTKVGFWWTGIAVFIFWNAFTVLGVLVGNALGDPKQWGLDAAASGAFIALLWPRLTTIRTRSSAVAAGAIALIASPHAPAGTPILIAALAAVVAGALPDKSEGNNGTHIIDEDLPHHERGRHSDWPTP